jgi:centromere/kinetochore protein ZW10
LLDTKCFDLRASIHDQFTIVWNGLIRIDHDTKTITVNKELPNQDTTLEKAIVGLKAYKMLSDACKKLWEDLDKTILAPRTDLEMGSVRTVTVEKVTMFPSRRRTRLMALEHIVAW